MRSCGISCNRSRYGLINQFRNGNSRIRSREFPQVPNNFKDEAAVLAEAAGSVKAAAVWSELLSPSRWLWQSL